MILMLTAVMMHATSVLSAASNSINVVERDSWQQQTDSFTTGSF